MTANVFRPAGPAPSRAGRAGPYLGDARAQRRRGP